MSQGFSMVPQRFAKTNIENLDSGIRNLGF